VIPNALLRVLSTVDGAKLTAHLASRAEYERAFPLFFRALAHEACSRLWERFPEVVAFVGEDCRPEAAARYPHLTSLNLNWVALAFPGVRMWDLHIGAVANLRHDPALIQVGVHSTPPLWARLGPRLEALDWQALLGQKLGLGEASVVGEVQLNEPARPLGLADLPGEVSRVADRMARYYTIVAPVPAEAGIVARG